MWQAFPKVFTVHDDPGSIRLRRRTRLSAGARRLNCAELRIGLINRTRRGSAGCGSHVGYVRFFRVGQNKFNISSARNHTTSALPRRQDGNWVGFQQSPPYLWMMRAFRPVMRHLENRRFIGLSRHIFKDGGPTPFFKIRPKKQREVLGFNPQYDREVVPAKCGNPSYRLIKPGNHTAHRHQKLLKDIIAWRKRPYSAVIPVAYDAVGCRERSSSFRKFLEQ